MSRAPILLTAMFSAGCVAAAPSGPAPSSLDGLVLGLDGRPAADVLVRIYETASVVSNNGGALVSNNGGNLIGDAGTGLIGKIKYTLPGGSRYALRAVAREVRSDAAGRFSLAGLPGSVNVEAVKSDDVRAIALGATAGAPPTLQLAYAGAIAGRVTAPGRPEVTDFEGVDVFVPGTGYVAKADRAGRFAIANVAPGAFTLVASRGGLGRAQVDGVRVASRATAEAPDLALRADPPAITALEPRPAVPGLPLTIRGTAFGASAGTPFAVTLGGATVGGPRRLDDGTISFDFPAPAASAPATTTLQVAVGGLPSEVTSFTTLASLGLADPASMWVVGERHPAAALGLDSAGAVAPFPGADVGITGAALRREGPDLVAVAAGEATLTLKAGAIARTRTIRVVPAGAARLTTFAGFGVPGRGDGAAGEARFDQPVGLALDADDSLYLADKGNARVVRLAPDGRVETIAGGAPGFADGPGTQARFASPFALALDGRGGLIVADDENERVRRIDLRDPAHPVTTLAGAGTRGYRDGAGDQAAFDDMAGLAVDAAGAIYVSEWGNHAVRKLLVAADGRTTVSTLAGGAEPGFRDARGAEARFHFPDGLAAAPDGTLYVADGKNHAVRRIAPDGTVTTLAGAGPRGEEAGGYRDGAALSAEFWWPRPLARGADGTIYVGDTGNLCVRAIAPDGTVTTVVRADGKPPGVTGDLGGVAALVAAPDGRVFISDRERAVIRLYLPR